MPDSWLILFNWDNRDSVDWALWYRAQWGIPSANLLGVRGSTAEHLADLAEVQTRIIGPVRARLASKPDLEQKIMGILLGYGMPGHYDTPIVNPEYGGFSISDALGDMHDDTGPPGLYEYQGGQRGTNYDCWYVNGTLPPGVRLTKATMAPNRYMTARIDAPSLATAKALTLRAKILSDPQTLLGGKSILYDYYDPNFPSGNHQWAWLRWAVEEPFLADAPWVPFDLDAGDTSPGAIFRFSVYQLWGWGADQVLCADAPACALAFDLNSYGALTVRSTTDYGGCFVPVALEAGYAAAIGATGEPMCCQSPAPEILLSGLRQGWTLGESYYLSNPYNDHMWTLVGDPFLRLPNWFRPFPRFAGDINRDGKVNLQDLAGFRACMAGPNATVDSVCVPFDFDGDGDYDLADLAAFQQVYTGGPVTPASGDIDTNGIIDLVDATALVDCQTPVAPTAAAAGCAAFDFDFDLDIDMRDFSHLEAWLWPIPLSGSDCNGNGTDDAVEIGRGTSADCNLNGTPDACDIALGASADCNTNAVPDECETDCNGNWIPDDCDLAAGTSADCNTNAVPDECETDCNGDRIPDDCDLAAGTSADCNANAVPDECETAGDCNSNGIPDFCEIVAGTSADCNGNGTPDACDLALGPSADCNTNAGAGRV